MHALEGNGQQSNAAAGMSQPAVHSAAAPLEHDENETQGQMTQRHKKVSPHLRCTCVSMHFPR